MFRTCYAWIEPFGMLERLSLALFALPYRLRFAKVLTVFFLVCRLIYGRNAVDGAAVIVAMRWYQTQFQHCIVCCVCCCYMGQYWYAYFFLMVLWLMYYSALARPDVAISTGPPWRTISFPWLPWLHQNLSAKDPKLPPSSSLLHTHNPKSPQHCIAPSFRPWLPLKHSKAMSWMRSDPT
jgi:hypothetical protein